MRMWSRFVQLLSRFETEHALYPKFVFDGYDLKKYATFKRENLALKKEKNKLPVLLKAGEEQVKDRCMSREHGFNYDTLTPDEEYVAQRKIQLEEEKKVKPTEQLFGPKNVPRYKHPDDKKLITAVKADLRHLQFNAFMAGTRDSMDTQPNVEEEEDEKRKVFSKL